MNKIKLFIGGFALVAVASIATIAYQIKGDGGIVRDTVKNQVSQIEAQTNPIVTRLRDILAASGILGGVTNYDILGLGDRSLTQASTTQVTSGIDNNGVFEWADSQACADATSTLASIVNPFRATSTATYAKIDVTEFGTTTALLSVGTTSASGIADPPVQPNLINLWPIQYGKKGTAVMRTGTSTPYVGEATGVASTTVSQLVLGPYDKIIFFASGTSTGATSFNYNGGVVGGNNTFQCRYSVKITR